MVVNKVGKEIPQTATVAHRLYEGELDHIEPYKEASRSIHPVRPNDKKIVGSLKEAIEKTGLKDGMTISFHHHFREGD